jgi:hypothetical protein
VSRAYGIEATKRTSCSSSRIAMISPRGSVLKHASSDTVNPTAEWRVSNQITRAFASWLF